jgi:hypothetical protein
MGQQLDECMVGEAGAKVEGRVEPGHEAESE